MYRVTDYPAFALVFIMKLAGLCLVGFGVKLTHN